MEVSDRALYDVLHYVHCEDCGGKGNLAIISRQSSPSLFESYPYDQILAACKKLEAQKCFTVFTGSDESVCLDPVDECICGQVLAELRVRLRQ